MAASATVPDLVLHPPKLSEAHPLVYSTVTQRKALGARYRVVLPGFEMTSFDDGWVRGSARRGEWSEALAAVNARVFPDLVRACADQDLPEPSSIRDASERAGDYATATFLVQKDLFGLAEDAVGTGLPSDLTIELRDIRTRRSSDTVSRTWSAVWRVCSIAPAAEDGPRDGPRDGPCDGPCAADGPPSEPPAPSEPSGADMGGSLQSDAPEQARGAADTADTTDVADTADTSAVAKHRRSKRDIKRRTRRAGGSGGSGGSGGRGAVKAGREVLVKRDSDSDSEDGPLGSARGAAPAEPRSAAGGAQAGDIDALRALAREKYAELGDLLARAFG